MNQLNNHWKVIFLNLSKIWGKMELPGMNELFLFLKNLEALILELYILNCGSKPGFFYKKIVICHIFKILLAKRVSQEV